MRRYDDSVEVRRGVVDGTGEGPAQFLWQGRLWKVSAVHAHWVETGPWWRSDQPPVDLVAEREVWRVEAARGRTDVSAGGGGVFDLVLDWAEGAWRLVRCAD